MAVADGSAVVAISNIGQASAGGGYIIGNLGGSVRVFATAFTTGGTATTLESVDILGGTAAGSPNFFQVQIYQNVGTGGLGSLLETLAGDSTPNGLVNYTSVGLALAASTQYFVVTSAPGNASDNFFQNQVTASGVEDAGGLPGFSIANGGFLSFDGGANFSNDPAILKFRVNTVPEPVVASFAALCGLFGLARRRR